MRMDRNCHDHYLIIIPKEGARDLLSRAQQNQKSIPTIYWATPQTDHHVEWELFQFTNDKGKKSHDLEEF